MDAINKVLEKVCRLYLLDLPFNDFEEMVRDELNSLVDSTNNEAVRLYRRHIERIRAVSLDRIKQDYKSIRDGIDKEILK